MFNHIAADYDRWYETPLGRVVDRLEKNLFIRMADLRPGERVLDAGCGTGRMCRLLADLGVSVVGVDVSEAMLDEARRRTGDHPDIDLVVADMHTLPFPSGSFDLVYAFTSLEFTSLPETVLRELWRVVRLRGRLVVAVLNAHSSWARHRRLSADTESVFAHARFYNPWELKAMLRRVTDEERIQWSSTVFIPPTSGSTLINMAHGIDFLGRLLFKPFGALIVMRVNKIKVRQPLVIEKKLPHLLSKRGTVVE